MEHRHAFELGRCTRIVRRGGAIDPRIPGALLRHDVQIPRRRITQKRLGVVRVAAGIGESQADEVVERAGNRRRREVEQRLLGSEHHDVVTHFAVVPHVAQVQVVRA